MQVVPIIFSCCLALAAGAGPEKARNRIVGGTPAAPGEFPWHVSVQFFDSTRGWEHWCDGSIISSEFLVTDLACSSLDDVQSRVMSGTLNWANGSTHEITERYVDDMRYVTLLRVDPPFAFGSDTGPVRLPEANAESAPDTLMTVSGWGEAEPFFPSEVLEKLDVPIVSKSDCAVFYPGYNFTHLICAGALDAGASMCSHPSYGAPLVSGTELRGLFFYSTVSACENPALYLEVSFFRDWITEITGI